MGPHALAEGITKDLRMPVPEENDCEEPRPLIRKLSGSLQQLDDFTGVVPWEPVRSKPMCLETAGLDFPEPRPDVDYEAELGEFSFLAPVRATHSLGVTAMPR